MLDEVDVLSRTGTRFSHGIMLSNGWLVQLIFHQVQMIAAPGLLTEYRADTAGGKAVTQPA